MIKEERAIKVLINVQSQFQAFLDEVDVDKDCREAEEDNKEVVNALEMAIKLLKQEPCEVEAAKLQQAYNKGFEDCKQSVLDTISELNAISFYEAQEDSKECYYEIRQAVENMPPATPKPKTGRWINGDDKCPCCGKSKFEGLDADIWADWQPKYCPNCGAKMLPADSEKE